MKLKAIFVNVDILQTLILKSDVFAHEQLSADWYGQVFADTTRTPPSTARRTTSACNTSDYRRRLPPTLSSTSFVALFTSKAKRLLAPLLVCAVASKIERALQNYLLLPLLLKNLKFVAAPLFTSLIDWKELPPGGENDKMRFSYVTCLV